MNNLSKNKMKALTQEAKKLLAIAAWLEKCASKRVDGNLGQLPVMQGQAEGLREAASIVKSYIGK